MSDEDDGELVPGLTEDSNVTGIKTYRRQRQAWTMYVAGASEDQIQERLGYATLAAVRAALSREARRHMGYREPEIRKLRDLELERLNQLQLAVWGHAVGDEDDQGRPSLPHLDRVLKIMEARARLLGLNNETKGVGNGDNITNNVLVIGNEPAEGSFVEDLKRAAAQVGVAMPSDSAPIELGEQ